MSLAQWCTDQLRPSRPYWWLLVVRVLRMGLLEVFQWRGVDPTVQFFWGNQLLKLPFSHNLPLYKAFTPLYDEPLRFWIQRLQSRSPQPLCLINVGANVGDTYALIQERRPAMVLAVEGDFRYLPFLRTAMRRDRKSKIRETFVGDGSVHLVSITARAGTSRIEATFVRESGQKVSQLPTVDGLVRQHPQWQQPDALVIDTDGFDWKVLRGSTAILRSHPVLFFEYYPDLLRLQGEEPSHFWEWLSAQGYNTVWLYKNTGERLGSFSLSHHQQRLKALPQLLKRLSHCPYVDVVATSQSAR